MKEAYRGCLHEPTTLGGISAVIWLSLNMALTLTNKYLYEHEDFKFPVFIIFIGTAGTLVGVLIFTNLRGDGTNKFSWVSIKENWMLLLLLAFFHAATSALINMSIVYISVSMSQLIKATAPAITLFLSCIFEKTRLSLAVVMAVFILVMGAFFTVFQNPEFYGDNVYGHFFGLGCAVASEFAGAAQVVISAILLQRVQMSSWNIIVVTSVPMLFFLIPFVLYSELEGLIYQANFNWRVSSMLLFSVVGAFCYTVSNYFLIQFTSSVFTSVVANLKVVFLVLISMAFFPVPLSDMNIVGMGISLLGFVLYNFLRMREKLVEEQKKKKVHNIQDDEEGMEMIEEEDNSSVIIEDTTVEKRERTFTAH